MGDIQGKLELQGDMVVGRPYILMVGGREHNVCLGKIGYEHLFGTVAINKVLLLIDRQGSGIAEVKVVLQQDEKRAVGPGDELFHSVPVVVPASALKIRMRLDAIDVVEDPWRPFLDDETVSPEGKIISEARLLAALPSLAGYYVNGRGFVKNPDVWSGSSPQPQTLRLPVEKNNELRLSEAQDAE